MIQPSNQALLWVVSGPSGSGKTTLCDRLLAEFPRFTYSVSCTTRAARGGEIDGKNYHFISDAAFLARAAEGAFLESAEVHDHRYGTLRESVRSALEQGRDVIMDIDVQGAGQVREKVMQAPQGDLLRGALVDVFLAPPSMADLERRLRDRAQDAPHVIERRLGKAREEMAQWASYRYLVVNDDLDRAYDVLRGMVLAEHHRVRRKGVTHDG